MNRRRVQSITLCREWALLACAILATGLLSLPALSQALVAPWEPVGTNAPPPGGSPVPEDTSTGYDFAVHSLFGNAREIEYNSTAKLAYLGCDHTFVVVSYADGTHPSLVGYLDLNTGDQNGILGMAYPGSGNYVYLVCEDDFIVVDVASPATPHVEGQVALPGGNTGWAVWMLGTTAYVPMYASGNTGVFYVINAAVPSAPVILGSRTTTYPAYGICAAIKGAMTYAYVSNDYSTSHQINVYNVTNPAAIGAPVTTFALSYKPWDIVVSGLYAYIANDTGGVRILNAPDDGSLSSLTTQALSGGTASGLTLMGTNLYVCHQTYGVSVVGVSTPGTPVLGATYNSSGTARDVAVSGSWALLADTYSATLLTGAPTTLTPTVPTFMTPRVGGVYATDRYAYYACFDDGLVIVDLADISRPSIVGIYDTVGAVDVVLSGSRAYVAVGNSGIKVVDVSDPVSPALLGSYLTPTGANAVKVRGSYAYVAIGTLGLYILDVSNPASMLYAGSYNTAGEARDVDIQGNVAYVADYSGGLVLLDVSDPASPAPLSSYVFPGGANGNALRVDAAGNRAYVTTNLNGIYIMDVSSPYYPWVLGNYTNSGWHVDAVVSGDYMFGFGFAGLQIHDISNPSSITQVGNYSNADNGPYRGFLRGGYLFADMSYGGAYILHPTVLPYDPYEVNDQFNQAYPITPSSYYRSKVSWSDDMDFYSFSLASCGTIQADMNPPAGKDYDLYLWDSSETLVGYSIHSGDSTESITKTNAAAGTYYLLVVGQDGSQYSDTLYYSLAFSTTASPVPLLAVFLSNVTRNTQDYAVLHIQDPNQPSSVTGYNIYRSDLPAGPFTLRAQNVVDMDAGTPNVQYVDVGSNGGDYYYLATAYNASCGAEGPQ